MPKTRIVLYSAELLSCSCFERIFEATFETFVADGEADFFDKISQVAPDVAVVCLCSAREQDAEYLVRLSERTAPVPFLVCSKTPDPGFLRQVARQGVSGFMFCEMEADKITDVVYAAIRGTGLREFIESNWLGAVSPSLHIPGNSSMKSFMPFPGGRR